MLLSRRGSLADQVIRLERPERDRAAVAAAPEPTPTASETAAPRPELEFFNGLGGFAEDGREYVTSSARDSRRRRRGSTSSPTRRSGSRSPSPGSGYTWSGNSRENQLTPWSNDPVSDPVERGDLRPRRRHRRAVGPDGARRSAARARPTSPVTAPDTAGSSTSTTASSSTSSSSCRSTTRSRSRCSTIENRSGRTRRLSVTAYAEWALGTSRGASAPWIVTDAASRRRRRCSRATRGTPSSAAASRSSTSAAGRRRGPPIAPSSSAATARRTARPASTVDTGSAGASGAGMDPCAALQTSFELAAGARTEVVVLLGEADDARGRGRAHPARARAPTTRPRCETWRATGTTPRATIQVRTPDRSMDIMLNRWLLYQTLACRLWARAAFYQAGGAYGFRDQLQDVIALVDRQARARPRAPAAGRGPSVRRGRRPALVASAVRSRRAHPHLRRPPVAAVRGRPLPRRHRRHARPRRGRPVPRGPAAAARTRTTPTSSRSGRRSRASLFEHCAAAHRPQPRRRRPRPAADRVGRLERRHEPGRPRGPGRERLAGLVPAHRRWPAFVPIAEARGEQPRAERWRSAHGALRRALERARLGRRLVPARLLRRRHAARLGDATPSAGSTRSRSRGASCRVPPTRPRAERAMAAVEEYLVRRGDGLVLLFTPPFDHSDVDPGLHQGIPAGRPRERRPVHARGDLVGARLRRRSATATRPASCSRSSTRSTTPARGPASIATRSSRTSWPADVYAEPPHVGRGGWTWYTGSAGWMYQAGVEWILGFRLRGTTLMLDPCIPRAWPGYEIDFRYHSATLRDRRREPARGQSRRRHRPSSTERTLTGRGARDPARRRRRDAPRQDRPRRPMTAVVTGPSAAASTTCPTPSRGTCCDRTGS